MDSQEAEDYFIHTLSDEGQLPYGQEELLRRTFRAGFKSGYYNTVVDARDAA